MWEPMLKLDKNQYLFVHSNHAHPRNLQLTRSCQHTEFKSTTKVQAAEVGQLIQVFLYGLMRRVWFEFPTLRLRQWLPALNTRIHMASDFAVTFLLKLEYIYIS